MLVLVDGSFKLIGTWSAPDHCWYTTVLGFTLKQWKAAQPIVMKRIDQRINVLVINNKLNVNLFSAKYHKLYQIYSQHRLWSSHSRISEKIIVITWNVNKHSKRTDDSQIKLWSERSLVWLKHFSYFRPWVLYVY